ASIAEPFVNPPPCIHTITGFLTAGLRFCVQTFRYWQFSFWTQKRCGKTSSSEPMLLCTGIGQTGPGLRTLDSLPLLDRLRLPEPFRFRVANAQERVRLALPDAAEFAAFHRDHGRVQVGAGSRCWSFSWANAAAPPMNPTVPSIFRRFMELNSLFGSFATVTSFDT